MQFLHILCIYCTSEYFKQLILSHVHGMCSNVLIWSHLQFHMK